MTEHKTPGVYVEEISKFPPSVAGVATAIPAFIGVTENCPTKQPVRITSLLDFEVKFGYGPKLSVEQVTVSNENELKYTTKGKEFVLYDSIRLFYDNGGGVCYVASIGTYEDFKDSNPEWDSNYKHALDSLKNIDEVTLLLAPDAAMLLGDNLKDLQKQMLIQCDVLGDRFAILDLTEKDELQDTLKDFRDGVTDHLSYGAAYYPYLISSYTKDISFDEMLKISSIEEEAKKIEQYKEYYAKSNEELAITAWGKKDQANGTVTSSKFSVQEGILRYNDEVITPEGYFKDKEEDLELYKTIKNLMEQIHEKKQDTKFSIKGGKLYYGDNEINDNTQLTEDEKGIMTELQRLLNQVQNKTKDTLFSIAKGKLQYNGKEIPSFIVETSDEEEYKTILSEIEDIKKEVESKKALMAKAFAAQIPGYAEKLAELQTEACVIPPSGAIAGIYAANDSSKGVWQAPANVGIASISGLTRRLSDADQADMNVDANTGKSVNAIRYFAGKGILVWGARTLDGNSNEWRYVPVRRLFNYIEESVQKSTAWAVFQPNDANTWVKIQCQIENFLNNLWRDGALAGSSPEKAFYVKVGLDVTMTAADILAGYLIVEIGIAAVRPAEFIVLKFSHKVQEV